MWRLLGKTAHLWPSWLYKIISKHPNPKTIYVSKLIQENLLTEDKVNLIEEEYKLKLEGLLKDSKKSEKTDGVLEDVILYSFLGIFMIFLAESFTKSGKYVR